MSVTFALAQATLREALRARVFVYLLAVALVIVLAAIPAADLSMGAQQRIAADTAMAAATVVGVFLALFLGVSTVSGEIERRTVYTVIAKASSRAQFVVGKFLGVWLTVSIAVVASYAMLFVLLTGMSGAFPSEMFAPLWMCLLEMGLLVAVAVFFSCLTRPLLSSGLAFALYLIGASGKSLYFWIERGAAPTTAGLLKALFWVLPNFEIFDIKTEVVHHLDYPLSQLVVAAGYSLFYSAFLLCCGVFIFHKRDLK